MTDWLRSKFSRERASSCARSTSHSTTAQEAKEPYYSLVYNHGGCSGTCLPVHACGLRRSAAQRQRRTAEEHKPPQETSSIRKRGMIDNRSLEVLQRWRHGLLDLRPNTVNNGVQARAELRRRARETQAKEMCGYSNQQPFHWLGSWTPLPADPDGTQNDEVVQRAEIWILSHTIRVRMCTPTSYVSYDASSWKDCGSRINQSLRRTICSWQKRRGVVHGVSAPLYVAVTLRWCWLLLHFHLYLLLPWLWVHVACRGFASLALSLVWPYRCHKQCTTGLATKPYGRKPLASCREHRAIES